MEVIKMKLKTIELVVVVPFQLIQYKDMELAACLTTKHGGSS
jgi:hypothetical protein